MANTWLIYIYLNVNVFFIFIITNIIKDYIYHNVFIATTTKNTQKMQKPTPAFSKCLLLPFMPFCTFPPYYMLLDDRRSSGWMVP